MYTGCIGVLSVFSIGDMIVYNRRKRAIFFAEEERIQANILAMARSAVAEGSATPAQTALVVGIAEEEEAMDKKKAERKLPSRLLWWAHGDWKEDEQIKEQRRLAVEDIRMQESRQTVPSIDASESRSILTAGGPLDNAAEKAAESAEKTGKGWLGWMMRGPKKE